MGERGMRIVIVSILLRWFCLRPGSKEEDGGGQTYLHYDYCASKWKLHS